MSSLLSALSEFHTVALSCDTHVFPSPHFRMHLLKRVAGLATLLMQLACFCLVLLLVVLMCLFVSALVFVIGSPSVVLGMSLLSFTPHSTPVEVLRPKCF